MTTRREPRERYATAARAGRDAIERAVTARSFLKTRDWRVLTACLALTALYSRTAEQTSVGQVAEIGGLSISRTSESLNRLADCGVISWKPSRTRGTSRLSLLDTQMNMARVLKRQRRALAGPTSDDDPSCPF